MKKKRPGNQNLIARPLFQLIAVIIVEITGILVLNV